jgi:hypothetical protein
MQTGMRLFFIGVLVLGIFPGPLGQSLGPGAAAPDSENSVTVFASSRSHTWNRLYATMFIREDLPDTKLVPDALDPPLWDTSEYLLIEPAHDRFLRILDDFLRTHAENLVRDPIKRGIMARDLWAIFDWSVAQQSRRDHAKEKRDLQSRLAEVMRRLALSPEEIRSLPSNFVQAVASGKFAAEYDPAHRERPWVRIVETGFGTEPVAQDHAYRFSRSGFLVFIKFPGGRTAASDYIRSLWDFPQPWIQRADLDAAEDQTVVNPNLPPLPAGTQVALVRQLILFDNKGNLEGTPITESVQIRVYRRPATKEDLANLASNFDRGIEATGQDFYEIRLSRPQLFAKTAGGLRAVEQNEKEFEIFGFHPADMGAPSFYIPLRKYRPVLENCAPCHRAPGINSLNIRGYLLKPNWIQPVLPAGSENPKRNWWEVETQWKSRRYDWGVLSGFWNSIAAHER